MHKHIIFISIDGMTDQLGQSQVLPYLIGLSKNGFEITIVSCEKRTNFEKNDKTIKNITLSNNITWKYCFYKTKIPLISQLQNFLRLKHLAENEVKNSKNTILHCRSYLPALIGLQLKKKFGTKYIFDMRGFWADERIDGNIWSLKKPLHKFLYKYFKRKEIELIGNADCVVTLTNTAKKEIKSWGISTSLPIEVIPCCADVNHFNISSNEEKSLVKNELNIPESSSVVGYLGSLGTWYMLDEMLDFFVELQKKKPNSILFFITNDNEQEILKAIEAKNINKTSIIIKPAKRHEVPIYISCLDIGLFFIKPLYSKKGSSPTKLAELLACGIPIITNTGVGDVDELILDTHCGVLISAFNKDEYKLAVDKIDILRQSKQFYRDIALANFSLQKGVDSYKKIYDTLFL
ncbi:MAG TPA: glycosyltransferase [Bacteroidia bacterium]|jgi:glycosyltransferase involved in cell wall biosynthesis|nr:glycosyltransferase [Bacteroidia bacterium]